MLKANAIFEPLGEKDTYTISASFKSILINALLMLFSIVTSYVLFKLKFEQTGPDMKLLAIPICQIST